MITRKFLMMIVVYVKEVKHHQNRRKSQKAHLLKKISNSMKAQQSTLSMY